MSEDFQQTGGDAESSLKPISHGRIVLLMMAISFAGSLVGWRFGGREFGLGVLLGGVVSIASYAWLKSSLASMMERAVAGEATPFQAIRFFFRYVVIAGVLYVIYLSGAFPMIAVLLGLASFAGAVIIEGFSRALSGFNKIK